MTAWELRRARIAVLGYFFMLGAATATWSARLPAIKAALHLSDGRLGLALFAVPAGSVLTLSISGWIADRFGPIRVTRIAGAVTPAALIPIGLGPEIGSLAVLVAALACYGALAGLLDVAMNVCGARLEIAYGRPILSSLHAGYSIAGLVGAGIGGLSAWLGLGPLPTFAAVAVALIVGGLVLGGLPARSRFAIPPPPAAPPPPALPASALPASALPASALPASAPPPSALPASALPASAPPPSALPASAAPPSSAPPRSGTPPPGRPADASRSSAQISAVIWILGLLALCGQLGEGSAGDWSAVYLHANLGTSAGFAAAGLAAFSVTMAAGRMVGDRLAARFGPVPLVRCSGLVAGLGLATGVLIATPAAAVVGFALLGAGLAGIYPQIVSSAARLDPARAGRNIGRIAAIAYSGLLCGPVAIGAAASGVGLRDALLIPAALALLVAAAASVLSPHDARAPAAAQPSTVDTP
jgi:MFS family permease